MHVSYYLQLPQYLWVQWTTARESTWHYFLHYTQCVPGMSGIVLLDSFWPKLIRHLTHTVHQLITLQLEVQHGCMPSSAWECLRNFCWMIPAMLSGYPPSFPSLGGWCLYLLSGGGHPVLTVRPGYSKSPKTTCPGSPMVLQQWLFCMYMFHCDITWFP